jgi:hypothetical protein
MKTSMDGGGGGFTSGSHTHSVDVGGHTHSVDIGGHTHAVGSPHSRERMYNAFFCLYVYQNGSIELAKNKYSNVLGTVNVDQVIPIFSKFIADLKLKDTNLDMFKEGLSELLQESINNTLKGDYYERAICSKSAGDGSNCDRST